jgi:two-component system OmpR family response regulator
LRAKNRDAARSVEGYPSAVVATAIPWAHVAPSVLIIDDDADARVYLEDVFRLEGFEVTALSDPAVVIGRIREELFHMLVVDLMMPKIDGIGLLAQIRALDEHIPVIMVTGYPSVETMSASITLGVSAYLAHPIEPSAIRGAIAQIARKPSLAVRHEQRVHTDIGRRIAEARAARGLTAQRLARLTRLPTSLLSQIERGEVSASISALLKIAAVLDVRLATLLAGY